MGSVPSVNPAVSNLLQNLSSINSSVLSSPSVVSALEKAPPADIVQLSTAATQLQGVDELFGLPDSSNTNINSLLAGVSTPAAATSPGSSTGSLADQLAANQASLQSAETQALFGTGPSSNSLLDVTG